MAESTTSHCATAAPTLDHLTPTGLQRLSTLNRRRLIMAGLVVTTVAAVTTVWAYLLGGNGIDALDIGLILCFLVSAPWTVLGFWNAVVGFWLLHVDGRWRTSVAPYLVAGESDAPISTKTAVLMTLRNEDPLGGVADTPKAGRQQARDAVESGAALDCLRTLVDAQDGDVSAINDPSTRPDSDPVATVTAPDDMQGTVTEIDALAVGHLAVDLGAGRRTKEDTVDPTAGLTLQKHIGEPVAPGDVLAQLYTDRTEQIDAFAEALRSAYTLGDAVPEQRSAVWDRYTPGGWASQG